MQKKKDYDQYIVKVNRHDKKGQDVSGLDPKKGGRRYKNGRMAALAYDFEEFDADSYVTRDEVEYEIRQELESKYLDKTARDNQDDIDDSAEFWTDLVMLIVCELIEHPEILRIMGNGIKHGFAKAKNGIKSGVSRVKSTINNKRTNQQNKSVQTSSKKKTEIVYKNRSDITAEKEEDRNQTFDDYRFEMTLEEAQDEYIQLFKDYLSMRTHAYRLQRARIIDGEMNIDTNKYLELMDSLVKKYPSLLDSNVQRRMFGILEKNKGKIDQLDILSAVRIDSIR